MSDGEKKSIRKGFFKKLNENKWVKIIASILARFSAIPLFILLHKSLPEWNWDYWGDRIVLLFLVLILTEIIFQFLRNAIFIIFMVCILILTFGSIFGDYGFKSAYHDYRELVLAMIGSSAPQDILISKLAPFTNQAKIMAAIDFDNTLVRNFAMTSTTKHFKKIALRDSAMRQIVQSLAVFKEINTKWNYVNDPKSREYYAKASESIKHFSGDCDDHSILMAASIKALGGTCRLILTDNHLYPELLVGRSKSLNKTVNYIKNLLFERESRAKPIHYHIDEDGNCWLNLDYTANYPGGRFMSERIISAFIPQ